MFRIFAPVLGLALFAGVAQAQHQLPLSPGIMPGSAIGPGTQFIPQGYLPHAQPGMHFNAGLGRRVGLGYGFGYGGYGGYGLYGYGLYGYGGYGLYGYGPYGRLGYGNPYGYGYYNPGLYIPPTSSKPGSTASEFPAVLTVQFPTASRVWLNGKQMKGEDAEQHVLTSPLLRPDENYTFNLKLRWIYGGKTYEAKRAVTLTGGDHSRLMIVSGDQVK